MKDVTNLCGFEPLRSQGCDYQKKKICVSSLSVFGGVVRCVQPGGAEGHQGGAVHHLRVLLRTKVSQIDRQIDYEKFFIKRKQTNGHFNSKKIFNVKKKLGITTNLLKDRQMDRQINRYKDVQSNFKN